MEEYQRTEKRRKILDGRLHTGLSENRAALRLARVMSAGAGMWLSWRIEKAEGTQSKRMVVSLK